MNSYNHSLLKTIEELIKIRGQLFDVTLEIAMQGELKEWNKSVPVGEQIHFTKDLFEGCVDTNILTMAQLITEVENACNSICNINNIPFPEEESK